MFQLETRKFMQKQQATYNAEPFEKLFDFSTCQNISVERQESTLVIDIQKCNLDYICDCTNISVDAPTEAPIESTESFRQVIPPTNCLTPEDTAASIWDSAWFELTQVALKEGVEKIIISSPKGRYEYSPEVLATTREYRTKLLLECGIVI